MRLLSIRNLTLAALAAWCGALLVSCATVERVWPAPFAAGKPATLSCSGCHANRSVDRETLASLCLGNY